MLPLYEAKMIHHFDHRFGTYDGQTQAQANMGTLPRLDPKQHDDPHRRCLASLLGRPNRGRRAPGPTVWNKGWLLGWRDVARSTDERTIISAAIPRAAVGDKFLLAFTDKDAYLIQANLSSFALDYVARQKVAGTSLKFYLIKQLPVIPPAAYHVPAPWLGQAAPADWIRARVIELSFTAWDMEGFAIDLSDDGPPFRWDDDRRFAMRAELDAAFFHLYGIDRDDVDYIMETFPVVKKRDEQRYGTFRTKELILEIYDAMTEAARTGKPYQTILDPPPGTGAAPWLRNVCAEDCCSGPSWRSCGTPGRSFLSKSWMPNSGAV